MRRRLRISSIHAIFALTLLTLTLTKCAVATVFTGMVTSLSRDSISVQPLSPPYIKAALLLARVDLIQTTVTIDDVNDSGIFESSATLADIRRGQQVTISISRDFAARIHIRPPLMLTGFVQGIRSDAIEVRKAGPEGVSEALQRFSIDALHLRVKGVLFDHGPELQLGLKDIATGQAVVILNARGRAYAVNVMPPAPTIGAVQRMTASALAIRVPLRSRKPGAEAIDTKFDVDLSTRYFNEYFGEPPEEVSAADFKPGQAVSVTAVGPHAVAVVGMYPAVGGKVVKVEAGRLTIKSGEDKDPNPLIRQYNVNNATKIFLGVARFTQPSPRGGTRTFYDYLPGGTLTNIKVGDRVSITAKRELALSMRVTPAQKQPVASISAASSK